MKRDESFGVIGRPHPRVEAPDKVTGRARYTTDVRLPGQLHGGILRSPLPHARILRIDLSAAAAHPGVHAVLGSANAPRIKWYGQSLLFDREVRYAGEEVAAVAAETPESAEDALRLIKVEYEPLPFAVELERGERGEADRYERGAVERALAGADTVIEAEYATQSALHNCLEPHGCVAAWEGERLTLHESTQGLFSVREEVARKLGVPQEQVRVIAEHMGGGFGSKQIAWKHSVIAALLARAAGRPVQLVLERKAENLAAGNRNATRQTVRLGAMRDGALVAIDARILLQSGAYDAEGEASDVAGLYQLLYRCANVRTVQVPVRTNTGPAVAFRAPGYAEAAFALECAMDELACKLRLDPIELRRRNYADREQKSGRVYTCADSLLRCYERVAAVTGARCARDSIPGRKRRGIGFAAADWPGGAGNPPGTAWVRLEEDGTALVLTGTQDIGTGTRTALCQIAAEELGLPLDKVRLQLGDTARGLYSPTSAGSATLATLGPAVRAAALLAKENRHGVGARGANPSNKTVRTCAAQCVEVEVDTETGELSVLRVVAANDCGRIVNPLLVDSQVIGAVTQGLGYATTEERVVDSALGLVLNPNLEEYKLPTAGEFPVIENATESMPDVEANVVGAKGIGEPPLIPAAPALANAVFDAIGVRLRDLPITREKLLAALEGRR